MGSFVDETMRAIKAYGAATPLTKAITYAAAFNAAALVWLILPDILAAFGVIVATWKNGTFLVFSALFFGVGLGQLISVGLFSIRPEDKDSRPGSKQQREHPSNKYED